MTAELLRRAAAEMRKWAEAATVGPWLVEDWPQEPDRWQVYSDVDCSTIARDIERIDAEYVASWHPAVAFAVANLLDKWAWMIGLDPEFGGRVGRDEVLAVARAYLGESA